MIKRGLLTEKMQLAAKKFHNRLRRIFLGVTRGVPFGTRHFFGIPRRYPKFPLEILAAALRAKNAIAFFGLTVFIIGMAVSGYSLNIESEVFANQGYIPGRYGCDAQDYSPPLSWSDLPQNTKSLVLICEDPDAPFQIWVHWVVFNIPIHVKDFEENINPEKLSTVGILQGTNDFGKIGYGGPCPPPGKPHRYFFKLYALDTTLTLQEGAAKKEISSAMQGHILAETETVGMYQR